MGHFDIDFVMIIFNNIDQKIQTPVYFVHIPKNAGMSIVNLELPWMISLGHSHPLVAECRYGPQTLSKIKFAIFREPQDRLVSLCEYAKEQSIISDIHLLRRFKWMHDQKYTDKILLMHDFLQCLLSEKENPEKFTHEVVHHDNALWSCIGVARQQVSWLMQPDIDPAILHTHKDKIALCDDDTGGLFAWKVLHDHGYGFSVNDNICVDIVLNYSEIDTEFSELCRLLNVPCVKIPRNNTTHTRENTVKYWDESNYELLNHLFGDDIKFWNQHFVS